MAAQTWNSLKVMLLATTVKAQPPFTVTEAFFDTLFPQATSYAEGRICRDLILLNQRQVNASLSTSQGSRTVPLSGMTPANGYGPLVVPEAFALITPAGTAPASGTRVQFDVASLDAINQMWPVEAAASTPSLNTVGPRLWAMLDDATIVYAPTADGAYTVEVTGLFQPAPLSAANQSTYISTVYPELLEAACMVFLEGALMHNFGAQSDDTPSAVSWEGQYHTLMTPIRNEELRRRGLAPDRPQPSGAPA